MAAEPAEEPQPRAWKWLWERLRGRSRMSLDRMEREMLVGKFERREFAGDPQQPDHYRVKTRNPQEK